MNREIDYAEYCHLYDIGIVNSLQKYGKSGVVSWIIPFGNCLYILSNRKEGIVGSMLRISNQKLLQGGKECL